MDGFTCFKRVVPVILAVMTLSGCGHFKGGDEPKHVLVDASGVQCEIVVPEKASGLTRFAGEELRTFMSQSFGADAPLVSKPSGEAKTEIILGDNPDLRKLGVDVDAIPRDGFVIQTDGNRLFIAGKDGDVDDPERIMKTSAWYRRGTHPQRGTLNGVYEFLERFLGARFYFPGKYGTIIPKHERLVIPDVDLAISPDHAARTVGSSGQPPDGFEEEFPGENASEKSWYYKTLDLMRQRRQTKYIPHCHGLREFGHIARFKESNPEYFALKSDGTRYDNPKTPHSPQLCYSSGIRDEIYKDVEAYLSGKSAESRGVTPRNRGKFFWSPNACQPGHIDIMPQDGFYPCNCSECQKHFNGTSYRAMDKAKTSEFMWNFFCEVADKLKKNGVPGYVDVMAYSPYKEVPERDVPDNVMVALCPPGPDARNFDETLRHIRDWSEKLDGRKVWLWINCGKYGGLSMPGVPFVIPKATGRYFKAVAPYIYGAYYSLSMNDEYFHKHLNAYVANKIMWDNDVDVDELLDEYYELMFGSAAGVMEEIDDRFEDIWLNQIRGNTVVTALGETSIPPSEYTLWDKIYSAEEIERIKRMFDQAEKDAADEPECLGRVKFIRKNLFEPLTAARNRYIKNLETIAGLGFHAPTLKKSDAIVVDGSLNEDVWKRTRPIHLRRFPFDVKDDETVSTLARVARDGDALYVSFDCEEPDMADEEAKTLDRDSFDIFRQSCVELFLNPSNDRKNYLQFVINPAGALTDIAGEKLASSMKLDKEWNGDFEHAVKTRADGWTVEMKIPIKTLESIDPDGFPINFTRHRVGKDGEVKLYTWSPFIKRSFHEIENFGGVRFKPSKQVNLIKDGDFTAPVKGNRCGAWYDASKDWKNKGAWAIDPKQFIGGGRSLRLTGERVVMRQSLPGLKPNAKYLLTFFIKSDKIVPIRRSSSCGARISVWDKKNNYFPTNSYKGTMPWTKQAFTFTTSPEVNEKVGSYIQLTLFEATGTVWYDDVVLKEIEEEPDGSAKKSDN